MTVPPVLLSVKVGMPKYVAPPAGAAAEPPGGLDG